MSETSTSAVEISPELDLPPPPAELAPAEARKFLRVICGISLYLGFTDAINGIGAPFIARSFHLDQSGIASLYAWISIAALGALFLSRMADRIGRRRVLLWCMGGMPLCALGAAVSPVPWMFAVFEVLLYAFIGATDGGSIVMLAEQLPIDQRARGQSLGGRRGLFAVLGAGGCLLLMPAIASTAWSWRWALLVSTAGILGTPWVAGLLKESRRWTRAVAGGAIARSGFHDIFGREYRGRAVPVLVWVMLAFVINTAVQSWLYYHIVSVVGIAPATASAVMFVGGAFGLPGFALGGWSCERFGRVPTVVVAGLLSASGAVAFYWGPSKDFALPALWLGACFAWQGAFNSAAMVGSNAAVSELFPTALRNTMMGWFVIMGAIGSVVAQAGIAVLAPRLGGLSNVVGYMAMLALPSSIIFGLFIDETRGLTLEAAAREQ